MASYQTSRARPSNERNPGDNRKPPNLSAPFFASKIVTQRLDNYSRVKYSLTRQPKPQRRKTMQDNATAAKAGYGFHPEPPAEFINCAAQGDILLTRVPSIPSDAKLRARENGPLVVVASTNKHDHVVNDSDVELYTTSDPAVCYLDVKREHAALVHMRQTDPHRSLLLTRGMFQVTRAREMAATGERLVDD